MNKISLIIGREYMTRVRKKSFIVMTLLGPILFAALIIVPGWLATIEDTEVLEIAVVEYDARGQAVPASEQFFRDVVPDKENMNSFILTMHDCLIFLKLLKPHNMMEFCISRTL